MARGPRPCRERGPPPAKISPGEREGTRFMMRLPVFDFRAPRTLEEAARILDGERANAMPLAGGTDLLPNMKRRQQVPRMLMSMRGTCCRRFMLGSRSVQIGRAHV